MSGNHHSPPFHQIQPKRFVESPYRRLSNVYIFESPKNNQRFAAFGIVCFAHLLLAEGRPDIVWYQPSEPPIMKDGSGFRQTVLIKFNDQHCENWYFTHKSQSTSPKEEGGNDPVVVLKTEDQIRKAGLLPQNWLLLCAAQNRARGLAYGRELTALFRLLDEYAQIEVQQALEAPNIDPGVMLAVIARQLAKGVLRTELVVSPFSRLSILARVK
ncbi:hypothetical protein [Cupriavidus nantongensis]|uniref:hypothetical protein n=1 Tax=Cupriavidus nantongensis TaxID=1796606 RepID=UPI002247E10B|nr:hypothetical protein [Cupriavidus nantongensis]